MSGGCCLVSLLLLPWMVIMDLCKRGGFKN